MKQISLKVSIQCIAIIKYYNVLCNVVSNEANDMTTITMTNCIGLKNKIANNLNAFDNRIEWLFNPKKGGFDFDVIEVEFTQTWVACSRTYRPGGSYYEKELLWLAPDSYINMFNVVKFDEYFFGHLVYEESKEDLRKVFIDQLDGRKMYYLKSDNGSGWYIA